MKSPPQTRIKLNSWLAPVLVGVIILVQLVSPYRGWVMLLVGFGGSLAVSYLWAKSLGRHLDLSREMRYGWAQVGDTLQERFTLINKGWAPGLWVEITNHSTLPDIWEHTVRAVSADSQTRWITKSICRQRGLFTLGPTSLQTGDPFGFFTVNIDFEGSEQLLVVPPVIPLPEVRVAPGGRAGVGRPKRWAMERTVDASSIRDYQYGDSMNVIHWPSTARRDQLYTRLFDSTPSGDWWVLLDMNWRVQVGEGAESTLENGIILAASIVDKGLRTGRAVGFLSNSASPTWRFPARSDSHRASVLHDLALLEPGSIPIEQFIEQLQHEGGRDASLILITADIDAEWVPPLVRITRLGVEPTVVMMDPRAFGAATSSYNVTQQLTGLGINHCTVTPAILDRPEARPGTSGQWEWLPSATGRAIPLRRPKPTPWREVSS